MPLSPLEYLRHIVDETEFLTVQAKHFWLSHLLLYSVPFPVTKWLCESRELDTNCLTTNPILLNAFLG